MLEALAKNWWALAIRGAVAVLFGLLALFMPGITLGYLVLLFGAYAVIDGVIEVVASFHTPKAHWTLLLEGLFSITAGILTFVWPLMTALILLYLIAFWAIVTGVFEIVTGIRLRKVITNEWKFIMIGVISLLFGVLILFRPEAGALAIVTWIGIFALITGILLLVFAFRLRGFGQHRPTSTSLPRAAA